MIVGIRTPLSKIPILGDVLFFEYNIHLKLLIFLKLYSLNIK